MNCCQQASCFLSRRQLGRAVGMITVGLFLSALEARFGYAIEPFAPLSKKSDFAQRLHAPHSGVIEGKPLRIALFSVANTSAINTGSSNRPNDNHINLWLDRKVDPGQPVSPGALGPTRYAALVSIASEAGCVCYPVDSCVVIGRPIWVAAMVQAFAHQNTLVPKSRMRIDVQWPPLTTPMEAAAAILGDDAKVNPRFEKVPDLPHDLWPSNEWHSIDRQVALKLVEYQFLTPQGSIEKEMVFSRSYRFSIDDSLRSLIQSADPESVLRNVSGSFQLQANLLAHTAFCNGALSQSSSSTAPGRNQNNIGNAGGDPLKRLDAIERTFTISIKNKPAGAVLSQLLSTAGIGFSFSPEANLKAQQLVSLSAEDESLGAIVRMVAAQAGLKLKSMGAEIQFTP